MKDVCAAGAIFQQTLSYTLEIAMFHTNDTDSRTCHTEPNTGKQPATLFALFAVVVNGYIVMHVAMGVADAAAVHYADKPTMDQSNDDDGSAPAKSAENFCNSLEGYNAMGKQLGFALAKMYGHQQSCTADNNESRKRRA